MKESKRVTPTFRKKQKVVVAGAAAGVLAMLVALLALPGWMPSLPQAADAGARLAFAAKWNALAAAPLFLAVVSISTARFTSYAIDPIVGGETAAMKINARVLGNTLEQYALFVAASFAIAATLRGDRLAIVAAASLIFIFARLTFWIGYRLNPLHRAFGYACTASLNLVLFGIATWHAWM